MKEDLRKIEAAGVSSRDLYVKREFDLISPISLVHSYSIMVSAFELSPPHIFCFCAGELHT